MIPAVTSGEILQRLLSLMAVRMFARFEAERASGREVRESFLSDRKLEERPESELGGFAPELAPVRLPTNHLNSHMEQVKWKRNRSMRAPK